MPSRPITMYVIIFLGFTLPQSTTAQPPLRPEVDSTQRTALPDDPAAIIAVVGQTPILLDGFLTKANAKIKDVLSKTKQQIPEAQLQAARVNLVRSLLAESIQNKMMRESFLNEQVGTAAADKRAEAEATLASRARQMFFESELPELKKQYKVDDLRDLDKILREKGTSLASRQRDFIDQMLGHLYIRSKVDKDPKVTIAEIAEYYKANKPDYREPTRARWEQMTALFGPTGDREAAHQAIWEMGREAYFGGNLQAVAREKSQEPLASQGGLHEWTEQGALASDALDKAIFSIELNAMSDIIEDEQGFHIIRVLDRKLAGVEPLSDVQDDIRATIRQQKIVKSQKTVIDQMRDRVPVWSLFPDDIPGAKPLPILRVAARPSGPVSR